MGFGTVIKKTHFVFLFFSRNTKKNNFLSMGEVMKLVVLWDWEANLLPPSDPSSSFEHKFI